ncbi:cell division topological specificity factor MinE [Dichelobacter nodosus]|uniref:Cell division topological specificity factor n=1 Tax=Dichelobacter nodosus (strain VCS1703A) TaxID=246195 RepID=A5EY78_DICNV|nr:cell division topological specificity factor MinE [Dichelobacter nodosus]ABQ13393.1 septum formation topological specificity factor MinE superfamily protein [Dichelobacter nodosus VCS1703A]AXM45707.1 hypothetical protein DYQ38_04310 [Dichelobacter nodosus]KNZ39173.1 hypothetical protein AKG33_05405 [Dichelobacter nodosus]TGA64530.1 hypothetical protein E5E99_05240 [Dichelobacter nodosus]
MSWKKFFTSPVTPPDEKKESLSSAEIAKTRLLDLSLKAKVRHQKQNGHVGERIEIERMTDEILTVVSKYISISKNDIHAKIEQEGDFEVLSVNVSLNEVDKIATKQ